MQLAQLTPPLPTTRPDAAKALIAVPMGVVMTATMTAMTKSMAGQSASRADLLAPLLEKLSIDDANAALLASIEGAITVAPELADRREALTQAAAGFTALLRDAAADTTKGDAGQALERLTTPLAPFMNPLMEAAALLDPSIVKPA